MYARPSTSQRRAPSPRAMKGGAPPTARNARTGLLTPPGITRPAASSKRSDSVIRQLHRHEVAAGAVPAEGGDRVHRAADDRGDDVDRARVCGLAAHQGLAAVGLREVGAGVDVRVIDDRNAEALPLEVADPEQVLGVDVVRRAGIARMAPRVALVQLVLGVPAAEQLPLAAAAQDDTARLEGVFLGGLRANRLELSGRDDHPPRSQRRPPARAGMIATSSPSFSGVSRPSMGSLLT